MSFWSELEAEEKPRVIAGAIALVFMLGLLVGYHLWRDRPAAVRVRIVASPAEIVGCEFVSEFMVQVGNPNPPAQRFAKPDPDLRIAENDLRQRAAIAGADTVLVTTQGLIVRGQTYRCRR